MSTNLEHDDFFTPLNDQVDSDDFFTPVKEPSRAGSLISAPIKGIIKGAQTLSLFPSFGPVSQKAGLKVTEQLLPTEEKLPEKLLERGGKLATQLAPTKGGILSKGLRAAAGSLAGEATKFLGGGELAQDIAELSAAALPDLSKSIPLKKSQERVVNFLKNRGFTENEITPLIQEPKKRARYAKFASKGEKTNKLMRDVYEKFDNVYGPIRDQAESLPGLSEKQTTEFLNEFDSVYEKIPKFYRRMIKEEVNDLLDSKLSFNDFTDLEQAINARIKGVEGGKAVIGRLKGPIDKAKNMISPELTSDQKLANELYRKRIDVSNHLKTKEISDLLDIAELGELGIGLADQNPKLLISYLGTAGFRQLAREMLINPRLQNISKRMLKAAKDKNVYTMQKLYKVFRDEAIKNDSSMEGVLPLKMNHEEKRK